MSPVLTVVWLSAELSVKGRRELLSCMKKPVSTAETPGYIYMYTHSQATEEVYYKVGRAKNVKTRMSQLEKSCMNKIVLVKFFPSGDNDESCPRKVTMCLNTHRVERLIHLELADRFGRMEPRICHCGKIHREWFRAGKGKNGWEQLRDVITRWVDFGRIAYGEFIEKYPR